MRGALPSRKTCQDTINDAVWAALQRCWEKEPDQRPSMQSLALFLDILYANQGSLPVDAVDTLLSLRARARFPSQSNRRPGLLHPLTRSYSMPFPLAILEEGIVPLGIPSNWPGCLCRFMNIHACRLHEKSHFDVMRYKDFDGKGV